MGHYKALMRKNTALDLHKAMELSNRVVLFFDRAVYYTALGYEKENV